MKITIGEIFKEFHSGDSIKAKEIGETGLYPVFGGNGLRGFTSTYNVDGEFVFIGRQGAYCGNTRYYNGKAFLTEHAIIAIPNEGFNAKYLEYKLDRANLYQFQAQAAQPGLSVSTLKRVKIDIADSSVQQKIGLLLSIIDRKIALNKQINCDLWDLDTIEKAA